LGDSKKKIALLGDVILVSVQRINPKKFKKVKLFKRKKFFTGTLHRGLIIRAKMNFMRLPGLFIKFNENTVVLVINVQYQFLIVYMVLFYVNYVCVGLL
jgi:ribosomal protein L14